MEFSTALLVCTGAALITIPALFYASKKCRQRGKRAPLPPGPSGLKLIKYARSLTGPFNRARHRVLARLAEEYGPVASFGSRTTGGMIVVVSSPAAAREALRDHGARLAGRFVPDTARALAHSAGSPLFLPTSDPRWARYREVIRDHVTSGALDRTRRIRERHARRLAEHFRACSGEPVAVGAAVLGAVLNAMCNVLFSRDVVQEAQASLKELLEELTAVSTESNVSDAVPFLAWLDLSGLRRRFSRVLGRLCAFLDEQFIEPRLDSGETHGDVMDAMRELYEDDKSRVTRADITKFFTDIFIAGSESSALTVQWAMAELLRHPAKMERVQAELAASLGSKSNKAWVEESDLDPLPYLRAVVNETLRLHPVAPLVPRVAVSDGVSLAGFDVPAGTPVVVNLWAVGRDAGAWPRPDEFEPQRFLGDKDRAAAVKEFAFKPFGAGSRACPGMGLANRFVPLLLASALHRVEWSLPDGMAPEDVDLQDNYRTVLDLATPLRAVPRRLD